MTCIKSFNASFVSGVELSIHAQFNAGIHLLNFR